MLRDQRTCTRASSGQGDPQRHRPHGERRRGARDHGPERLGQEHAGPRAGRPSEYEVTGGEVAVRRARTCSRWPPRSARARACSWRSSTRSRFPGVSNAYFLKAALNAHPRSTAASRSSTPSSSWQLVQAKAEARSTWTRRCSTARSTRASRAARRSATRSSRWRCSSRGWRSSTRPTRGSTSTRCKIVADGVNAHARPRPRHPRRHALPAPAQLHRARLRPRADRRPDRPVGRQGAGARARGEGLRLGRRRRPRRRPGEPDDGSGSSSRGPAHVGARFERVRRARRRPAGGPGLAAHGARAAPSAAFAALGFPTTRDEEWRFTSVAPIAETRVRAGRAAARVRRRSARDAAFGAETAARAGVRERPLRAGAVDAWRTSRPACAVGALSRLLAPAPADRRAAPHAGRAVRAASPFTALNTAFLARRRRSSTCRDERGRRTTRFTCCSLDRAGGTERVASAGAGRSLGEHSARCAIVETYAAAPDGHVYFTNAVTEFVAGDRAVARPLQAAARERGGVPRRRPCSCARAASTTFVSHNSRSAAALARNDVDAVLDGEGSDMHAERAVRGRRHAARRQPHAIDHAQPHCGSHELYKGILGGRARGVFNGKIIVRPDAQKTDAKQTNKALLLSDDGADQHEAAARDLRRRREVHARRDGRPARRGRAVLSARARARPATTRAALLIHAFAGDVVNRMQFEPLRARLEAACSS